MVASARIVEKAEVVRSSYVSAFSQIALCSVFGGGSAHFIGLAEQVQDSLHAEQLSGTCSWKQQVLEPVSRVAGIART